jgi:hypothetical protein
MLSAVKQIVCGKKTTLLGVTEITATGIGATVIVVFSKGGEQPFASET